MEHPEHFKFLRWIDGFFLNTHGTFRAFSPFYGFVTNGIEYLPGVYKCPHGRHVYLLYDTFLWKFDSFNRGYQATPLKITKSRLSLDKRNWNMTPDLPTQTLRQTDMNFPGGFIEQTCFFKANFPRNPYLVLEHIRIFQEPLFSHRIQISIFQEPFFFHWTFQEALSSPRTHTIFQETPNASNR